MPVPSAAAAGDQKLHSVGSPACSAGSSLLGSCQLLASDSEKKEFTQQYKALRFLTYPSSGLLSLLLRGLTMLSERAEVVSSAVSGQLSGQLGPGATVLSWDSGGGVTAPNTLPACVCLESCAGLDFSTEWKVCLSHRQEGCMGAWGEGVRRGD